jgi:hypothetical protein
MLFLLLQTLDDVEEPNFGNGDQGNDHHQGFHIEFTKHLHVCIIVKKKVCIWSNCSYADTLIFAAAPEDINLPEPYQYNMDPPNRDERFFGFNHPSFV